MSAGSAVFALCFAFEVVDNRRAKSILTQDNPFEDCSMVVYRPVQADDYAAVQKFLADNGWAARVKDAERFRAILERADRTVVALDDGRVVGFARALCDGVSNGYISMVAVAEDRRRQGIGRRLVEQLMQGDAGGEITWVLRAGRDSPEFWGRLGFEVSDIAMERVRRG